MCVYRCVKWMLLYCCCCCFCSYVKCQRATAAAKANAKCSYNNNCNGSSAYSKTNNNTNTTLLLLLPAVVLWVWRSRSITAARHFYLLHGAHDLEPHAGCCTKATHNTTNTTQRAAPTIAATTTTAAAATTQLHQCQLCCASQCDKQSISVIDKQQTEQGSKYGAGVESVAIGNTLRELAQSKITKWKVTETTLREMLPCICMLVSSEISIESVCIQWIYPIDMYICVFIAHTYIAINCKVSTADLPLTASSVYVCTCLSIINKFTCIHRLNRICKYIYTHVHTRIHRLVCTYVHMWS